MSTHEEMNLTYLYFFTTKVSSSFDPFHYISPYSEHLFSTQDWLTILLTLTPLLIHHIFLFHPSQIPHISMIHFRRLVIGFCAMKVGNLVNIFICIHDSLYNLLDDARCCIFALCALLTLSTTNQPPAVSSSSYLRPLCNLIFAFLIHLRDASGQSLCLVYKRKYVFNSRH